MYSLCTMLTNGHMAVTANGPFQQTYTFTTKQNKLRKYKVEYLWEMWKKEKEQYNSKKNLLSFQIILYKSELISFST